MNIQWFFSNCSKKIKSEIRTYWQHKLSEIERLASVIPTSAKKIRLSVYYHPKRVEQYEARAVLEIPGRSLAVQSSAVTLTATLDTLADGLAAAVQKYKNLVHHTFRQQRKQRNVADLASSLPMLIEDEKSNRKESFFALLRPIVTFLEEQAKRELTILEMEGVVKPDFIASEELVDEVVVKAWEQFSEKPEDKTLEHWLTSLLYELLQTIEWESSQFISLDEIFDMQEIDHSAEADWMAEVIDSEDKLTIAELLPDEQASAIWEEMGSNEQKGYLYSGLQQLSALSRQAYMLSSVEEYSPDEIANIQNRSAKDVKFDIIKGREALQDHLHGAGMIN